MVSPYHQRLTFALGPGDHDIWFEVRVNRAYGTDRSVTNTASATIDLKELDPMTLAVEDKLTIKPYVGPTFKVYKTGPDTVKWRTNVSWEMTFIVKDSYSYKMQVGDCEGLLRSGDQVHPQLGDGQPGHQALVHDIGLS